MPRTFLNIALCVESDYYVLHKDRQAYAHSELEWDSEIDANTLTFPTEEAAKAWVAERKLANEVSIVPYPLELLQSHMRTDIEYASEHWKAQVASVTWDRDQALAAIHEAERNRRNAVLVDLSIIPTDKARVALSEDVVAVFARLNAPLPRTTLKSPEWRTPAVPCWGHVNGLPNSRGRLLATNGIRCLIEREDGKWSADWHYDWFIPDREENLPMPQRERKSAAPRKSALEKAL